MWSLVVLVLGPIAPALFAHPLGPLLLVVSAGGPALRLVQANVFVSILWLRTLLLGVRSRVFEDRGPVLRPCLGDRWEIWEP